MFTFCWILLLFINGAEAREFNLTGCLHRRPERIYQAITNEDFVLECVLPSQNHTHFFKNSVLYKSEVLWLWQQKDGEPLKIISNESTNPTQEGDVLWFRQIEINAAGIYICIREEVSCLKHIIEVQEKSKANCTDNGTNELFLVFGQGHSISCPGIHCYNHLQRSSVTWYKNGIQVKHQEFRPGLKLKDDKINLLPVYKQDAGIYVCDYILFNNIQWTMRRVVRVNIITRNTVHTPNILYPSGMKTIEVELGKPLDIECKVLFGFERDFLPAITWYRESKESKGKQLIEKQKRIRLKELEGESFVHVVRLSKVTERDLHSNFTCFAQNSVGNATGVVKLKRKKRALFIYILYGMVAVLAGLLLGSAFVYQHWIEIVLMYRNYLAKDETVGDCKEFDAFVSYAKQNTFGSESTFLDEEQFALQILPEVLENKYGYKLCLLERDILPGGAYTEDIVTAIKQSRRAIIILSPGYVNGPSIFELQAAVNCALEDKTIKLILIKYQSFQEPASLPPIVKKALKILPVVTWKSSSSASSNKQFWKYMQYHMPVKSTRRLGNDNLKIFSKGYLACISIAERPLGEVSKEVVR